MSFNNLQKSRISTFGNNTQWPSLILRGKSGFDFEVIHATFSVLSIREVFGEAKHSRSVINRHIDFPKHVSKNQAEFTPGKAAQVRQIRMRENDSR